MKSDSKVHLSWVFEKNNKLFCRNNLIWFEGALLNTLKKDSAKIKRHVDFKVLHIRIKNIYISVFWVKQS